MSLIDLRYKLMHALLMGINTRKIEGSIKSSVLNSDAMPSSLLKAPLIRTTQPPKETSKTTASSLDKATLKRTNDRRAIRSGAIFDTRFTTTIGKYLMQV